ncbi:hypothetical protein PVK06_017047 [Gossypium arboreum]|uniref:Uncharacterized protein n=1 Tax=Gossypium arboreum TaxID=29729 RepID=A0ABR0Q1M2_GOSAR|nr:hypothetical protein PVK06_017047 [Gossypium arboreum]
MAKQTHSNENKEESKIDTWEDSRQMEQKRKEKGCEEDSISNSPLEKRSNKPMYDGLIRFKNKRKRLRGSNGDNNKKSSLKIARRRLLENVSPGKAVAPPRAMKILCWSYRGIGNPATVRELRQLLVANDLDIIFLCETKTHTNKLASICSKCRMEECLAVNAIEGQKPRERIKDPRLKFRYNVCWAKDNEAKNIIKNAWQNDAVDIMGKILMVGHNLRDW